MKLVLTIAVISKGQQQQQNLQQKINELYTPSNKLHKSANVQIEQQKIKVSDPITFPTSDEDDHKFPDMITQNINSISSHQNVNSILQSVDQGLPAPAPFAELTRPTRVAVAVAATSAAITNRYTDDQLDYVRDFAWTMFQV